MDAHDLFVAYAEYCGTEEPVRSEAELMAEFHARNYKYLDLDGEDFLEEIFDDEWAYGAD